MTAFPACDKVMLLPPANVIVPEEINASTPAVLPPRVELLPPTETDAVIVLLDRPNETPLEFANEIVPEVFVEPEAMMPERPV